MKFLFLISACCLYLATGVAGYGLKAAHERCLYWFGYLAEETLQEGEAFELAADCQGSRTVDLPKRGKVQRCTLAELLQHLWKAGPTDYPSNSDLKPDKPKMANPESLSPSNCASLVNSAKLEFGGSNKFQGTDKDGEDLGEKTVKDNWTGNNNAKALFSDLEPGEFYKALSRVGSVIRRAELKAEARAEERGGFMDLLSEEEEIFDNAKTSNLAVLDLRRMDMDDYRVNDHTSKKGVVTLAGYKQAYKALTGKDLTIVTQMRIAESGLDIGPWETIDRAKTRDANISNDPDIKENLKTAIHNYHQSDRPKNHLAAVDAAHISVQAQKCARTKASKADDSSDSGSMSDDMFGSDSE